MTRTSRRRTRAILAGLASLGPIASGASAQEPLFLRIRPSDAAPGAIGRGGPSDAEIARAAHAAREAVWARSTDRARLAIASVCTGCLARPPPVRPAPPVEPPSDGGAAPIDPSSTRGVP